MKVVVEKSILNQIFDAKLNARHHKRVIKYIKITQSEYEQLKVELKDSNCYNLLSGERIELNVYGIRIIVS